MIRILYGSAFALVGNKSIHLLLKQLKAAMMGSLWIVPGYR
jgi:hypothetical protein